MATIRTLVGTKKLETVITNAIATAFVENSIPISIMLVADSGAGKSKTLIRFQGQHIMRCDDLTTAGLFDMLANDPKNEIRFLLIPDFNPVLSHKSSVSSLLIANLLSVTQDGTVNVQDGRQKKEMKHEPVGILTAVTPEMFIRYSKKWRELGVTRRIIPLHYTYSPETIMEAQTQILEGRIDARQLDLINCNLSPRKVMIPLRIAKQLKDFSTFLANNLSEFMSTSRGPFKKEEAGDVKKGKQLLPLAPHVVLRAIAQGAALKAGRNICNSRDVEAALQFLKFTSMSERVAL